jgi:pimeloyl-ACP methyl ester carboxylesterase
MPRVYALVLLIVLSGSMRSAIASVDNADDTLLAPANGQCDQPKERYIDVDNTHLRYVENGAGPGVVLIHGNAGSVDDFSFGALGPLCGNHRVIAVDRPGHGKSNRPNGSDATLEFQTRLLHEALLQLGVTRPVLVGHSWGGALALAYAVAYPKDLSGVVLLAPAAYPDGGPDQFMRALLKTPVIGDVTLTIGRICLGPHMLSKELREAFYPDAVPEDYLRRASSSWLKHKQVRAILEDEYGLDKELKKLSKHYSEISVPVVIVTGDHDKVVSAEANAFRLKTTIRQAQLIELKNTGHQVPQTHPESISNALSLISTTAAQSGVSER